RLRRRLGVVSVRAVRSGQDTLDLLAASDWSLLVVHHQVGEDTAEGLLRRIRSAPELPDFPIICCLERNENGDLPSRLVDQLGVSELLFQPLDLEELAQRVASMLGIALPPPATDPAGRHPTTAAIAGLWEQLKDAIVKRVAIF